MPRSSHRSRRTAEAHDQIIGAIAAEGLRPVAGIALKMRAAAIRAHSAGRTISVAMAPYFAQMMGPLQQAMTASHLTAMLLSRRLLEKSLAREDIDGLRKWLKVADYNAVRAFLSDEQIQAVFDSYGPAARKVVEGFIPAVNEKLERAVSVPHAPSARDAAIPDLLKAFDATGLTKDKPWLIETTFRTQSQLGFAVGQHIANQDPAIKEILWGQEYVTVGDDRVRPEHAALDGLRLPIDDPRWQEITPPNGWNCFAAETIVEGAVVAGSKALYAGTMIEIETQNGCRLTVTPNHPVATRTGWRKAGSLHEGDDLLTQGRFIKDVTGSGRWAVTDQHAPSEIHQVFDSLCSHGAPSRTKVSSLDFHSDAASFRDRHIDVVRPFVTLMGEEETAFSQETHDAPLALGDMQLPVKDRSGSESSFSQSAGAFLEGDKQRSDASSEGILVALRSFPADAMRIGKGAESDVVAPHELRETPASYARYFREMIECLSADVSPDKVARVRRINGFRGHVYDLQTVGGWIIAGGVLCHNCRCSVVPILVGDSLATRVDVPQFATVDGEQVRAGADAGWDFHPGNFAEQIMQSLPPGILNTVRPR